MDFFTRLEKRIDETGTLLCIGLDPQFSIPDGTPVVNALFDFNRRIIEETAKYTLCYKPNIAFYEQYGIQGLSALEKTMEFIPDDIPVILDAKRNDIGNTAKAYATGLFDYFKADAVTLNPYMGRESVEPFLEWKEKGFFMLCRTSNPGAAQIQELLTTATPSDVPEPLFIRITKLVQSWSSSAGIVVGGNDVKSLAAIREVLPDIWILAPGIGAQGGTPEEAVINGCRNDGKGLLPMVGRYIINDPDPRKKAQEMHEAVNMALEKKKRSTVSTVSLKIEKKKNLIRKIIKHGCFKVGRFTLKSGDISPFYIDMRILISDPTLLSEVADAYCELLSGLEYKRLSAIPVASVPIATAISLKTGEPMIYPRIPKKKHGTGNSIEGAYNQGETVVLVDDLISAGVSKVEALEILREENLLVHDLVVFIERGTRGRQELAEYDVKLHTYTTIEEILSVLQEMNGVTSEQLKEIDDFLKK